MTQPFLALITPLSDARPDNSLPGGQPGVPTPPIYYPPYPSTGPGFPTHPIAPGGQPPYPSQGPGFPTHPIAPGGQPPYPDNSLPPYLDQGLPGFPPPGSPGTPTHPIVIPPPNVDNTLPSQPQNGFIVAYMPGVGYRWVIVPTEGGEGGESPSR